MLYKATTKEKLASALRVLVSRGGVIKVGGVVQPVPQAYTLVTGELEYKTIVGKIVAHFSFDGKELFLRVDKLPFCVTEKQVAKYVLDELQ